MHHGDQQEGARCVPQQPHAAAVPRRLPGAHHGTLLRDTAPNQPSAQAKKGMKLHPGTEGKATPSTSPTATTQTPRARKTTWSPAVAYPRGVTKIQHVPHHRRTMQFPKACPMPKSALRINAPAPLGRVLGQQKLNALNGDAPVTD